MLGGPAAAAPRLLNGRASITVPVDPPTANRRALVQADSQGASGTEATKRSEWRRFLQIGTNAREMGDVALAA